MKNKEKYREFCKTEKNIPIFSKDWWLDSVCNKGEWDVALVEKGGQIVASMPYYVRRFFGLKIITMPKLTQNMGPYIKYPPGQKYYKTLSWDKKITEELISQFPATDFFQQNFHHSIQNWLPFYWHDFQQTTSYTYLIENTSPKSLLQNCETDIRRRRRRKAKKAGIKVIETQDVESFYKLNKKTFARKDRKIPYSLQFFKKVFIACHKHNACKIILAVNSNETIVAGGFFVEDYNTVYYLMGGIDPEYKDLGAMDLLLHNYIVETLDRGKNFDFEGSMIESIEKYFRSFGAIQKPYCHISKTNSRLFAFLQACRRFIT
jgi:lipid II:glycine glycyltransferase (peptidoglycan interpeptide bridge formation enzyme)